MRMESGKGVINLGVLCLVPDQITLDYLTPLLQSCATKLSFRKLHPADLRSYEPPRNLDAVILLHPYTEGRLSLTDVTDARYSTLLPTISEHYGSQRICVIAYLVRDVKEHTQKTHLEMLKSMQPKVIKNSDYIIICGNLKDMFTRDLLQIKQFIKISWETTTQKSWEDEWYPKALQIATTDTITHHTQRDEDDPSDTNNGQQGTEQATMHANYNTKHNCSTDNMETKNASQINQPGGNAQYGQRGTEQATMHVHSNTDETITRDKIGSLNASQINQPGGNAQYGQRGTEQARMHAHSNTDETITTDTIGSSNASQINQPGGNAQYGVNQQDERAPSMSCRSTIENVLKEGLDALEKARCYMDLAQGTTENELKAIEKEKKTIEEGLDDIDKVQKTLKKGLDAIKKGKRNRDKLLIEAEHVLTEMETGLKATEKGKKTMKKLREAMKMEKDVRDK